RRPIDTVGQTVGGDVGHADADAAVVGQLAQVADKYPFESSRVRPGIVLAVYAAVGDLGVHAGAADVLADFVKDQNIEVGGDFGHPGLHQRQVLFFALFHGFHGHRIQFRGVVVGILHNGETAQNFAGLQHLASYAANHVLQAQTIGVGMVALRAREFADADGHHFEQAALNGSGEIGMPLD